MSKITSIKQLVGKTWWYKGSPCHVKDAYPLDGQVILETNNGTVKIDKSQIKNELKGFSSGKVDNVLGDPNEIDPIKPNDEPADSYYGTRDYSKFVFNEKNRRVNAAHVNNLVSSIKENDLLFAQPILVNSKYEIIDGQHRFHAAKKLGKRIYYIIKPGLSIEDAITLNINTKNWGYKDYLDYWISQGNENYIYFRDYLKKYGISYSLATSLLMKGTAIGSGGHLTDAFNNGDLEINHKEYAELIGELVLELNNHGDFAQDRSFIIALVQSMNFAELSPEFMIEKIAAAPDKFTKCSDAESYTRMLEDVVNYRKRGERVRLY